MLKYNRKLTSRARELHKGMTKEEKQLWYNFLRDYPLRFRRQRVIGNFIADFYCAKAKLIIEIDGKHHLSADNAEYDKMRSEYLKSMGINVLRFKNDEINSNFNYVCAEIESAVNDSLKPVNRAASKKS